MKKWLQQFRFSFLLEEIERYGFHYSFKEYLMVMAGGMTGIWFLSEYLHLRVEMAALLGMIYLLLLPGGIRMQFRYLYEQKRFEDITTYMQYLMYSFKRNRKIVVALDDTAILCSGELQPLMVQAMEKILYSDARPGIYQEAFAIIEEQYECIRLSSIHSFLIQAERKGGNPSKSLQILQDDLQNWVENTYAYQKERKNLQTKVMISIVLSAIISMMMYRLLPLESGDIASSPIYQVVTTGLLISFLFLIMLSQKAMVHSWLKDDHKPDEKQFARDYELYTSGKGSRRKRRYARKRMEKEVLLAFPVWLRELALYLQTENVYNAILKSIENCSYVLEEELTKTLAKIEQEPNNMASYCTFFEGCKMSELQSVFIMLYSMTEIGSEESDEQIYNIMQRNNLLTDKAAKLANEDAGFLFAIYMLMPMVLSAAKLLVDMGLFMMQFMAHYSTFV